jgi:hypothetical protein
MTSSNDPLAFTKLMPGLDFMQQFAQVALDKAMAPNLKNWVAPTASTEEIDKRIADLKAVQFWLEQNVHVLRSTVQALEVQKMTLATLQGMNLNLADISRAFAVPAQPADAASSESVSKNTSETPLWAAAGPETAKPVPPATEQTSTAAADQTAQAPAMADPVQWWGALTRQFQTIADSLNEAAQAASASAADPAPAAKPARKSAAKPAAKKPAAQKKTAKAASRKGGA